MPSSVMTRPTDTCQQDRVTSFKGQSAITTVKATATMGKDARPEQGQEDCPEP